MCHPEKILENFGRYFVSLQDTIVSNCKTKVVQTIGSTTLKKCLLQNFPLVRCSKLLTEVIEGKVFPHVFKKDVISTFLIYWILLNQLCLSEISLLKINHIQHKRSLLFCIFRFSTCFISEPDFFTKWFQSVY